MRLLGNLLWLIFGGLLISLEWLLAGLLLCCTIIGLPAGLQCFKLAGFALFPFGKEVAYGGGTGSFLLNLLWIVLFGWEIALSALAAGAVMFVTVIGIPFAWQSFKIAKLAFMPFGATVRAPTA